MSNTDNNQTFVNTLAGITYEIEDIEEVSLEKNRKRAKRRKNNFRKASARETLAKKVYGFIYPDTHRYSKAPIFATSSTKGFYDSRELKRRDLVSRYEMSEYLRGEYDMPAFE